MPRPVLLNLFAAEWLKLRKRPLALGLLAVFLILLFVQMGLQFMVAALALGRIGGIMIEMLPAPQLASYRAGVVLPGAFGTALGHANGIGGICAIILTAGVMGNEYSWGTLRMQLARQPSRRLLLLARILALLAGLAVALLSALGLAALLSLVFGAVLKLPSHLDQATLLALPGAALSALYVWLPYVLLTLVCTIFGRSALAGIMGGLLYLVFEVGLGGLTISQVLGGLWAALYNLTIGQNINALVVRNSRIFGLDPAATSGLDLATLPPIPQAVLIVAIYSALFLGYAIYLLETRDVQGPT